MSKGSMGRRTASEVDTIRTGSANWGESGTRGWIYGMNHTLTMGVDRQARDGWDGGAR
jgi:hypothetical protein